MPEIACTRCQMNEPDEQGCWACNETGRQHVYPENEKLGSVVDEMRMITEFLEDFLPPRNVHLAQYTPDDNRAYPLLSGKMQGLMYEFFDIDAEKLEAERREMLDVQRALNAAGK